MENNYKLLIFPVDFSELIEDFLNFCRIIIAHKLQLNKVLKLLGWGKAMLNSLNKKIIISITSIILIYTLAFMSISYLGEKEAVENQMKEDGSTLITQINSQLEEYTLNEKDKIRTIFKSVVDGSKGNIKYVSIVDSKMNMLVGSDESASNSSTEGNTSTDAVSSASQNENSTNVSSVIKDEKTTGFTFESHGEKVYNVSMPYYDASKLMGTINLGISLKGMNSIIVSGLLRTAEISALFLLAAIAAAVIISKNLTKPLNKIVSGLDSFAAGDFTTEFKTKSKDEIGRLTVGLNNTVKVLRETLEGIKQIVTELNEASYTLKDSGEIAASSSHTVQGAISEVSQEANEQALNIAEMAEIFEELSSTLDIIKSKSGGVVQSSIKIKQNADSGSENLAQLITAIGDVRKAFVSEEEKIQVLGTYVGKIGEITDVINNVAEQTNLLALNAAIEAARAGEAGRGFSVVADEIRKLAEQVMESSKNINQLIKIVESSTAEVTSNTKVISDKINGQVSILEGTVTSFKDIEEEVGNSISQMDGTYELIESTVNEKDKIVSRVETLSTISEEVSASAREITASTEEQASSIDNLSKLAQTLNTMADRLAASINKFKI